MLRGNLTFARSPIAKQIVASGYNWEEIGPSLSKTGGDTQIRVYPSVQQCTIEEKRPQRVVRSAES